MSRPSPVHLVAGEGAMCGVPLQVGMHGVFTIGGTTCSDCLMLADPSWQEGPPSLWFRVRAALALPFLAASIVGGLILAGAILFALVVP